MHAGSWHNRYPGDTRINLDLAGLVSLYDTTLAPSLVGLRDSQERCDHRIQGISPIDIEAVRSSVSHALERSQSDRSGVDWKTLFRVVVDRYSDRLDLMEHLLSSTLENDAVMDQAKKVHVQLRVMLTSYIFHATVPSNASFDSAHSWATPVFKACGTAHTSSIASYMPSLNPSERLLLQAVQETTVAFRAEKPFWFQPSLSLKRHATHRCITLPAGHLSATSQNIYVILVFSKISILLTLYRPYPAITPPLYTACGK
jgi:hypothetical protein